MNRDQDSYFSGFEPPVTLRAKWQRIEESPQGEELIKRGIEVTEWAISEQVLSTVPTSLVMDLLRARFKLKISNRWREPLARSIVSRRKDLRPFFNLRRSSIYD